MAVMTGGQAAVESLIAHGVDTIFGVISVHTLDMFDALRERQDKIRFIGTRHESAATYMAYGYAQVTGKPGVILSSTGPGAGNTLGALGEAHAASVPILHITTDVDSEFRNSGRGDIHEPKNQLKMFESVTAWNTFVPQPEGVSGAIYEAFEHMNSERPRPVDVEIATTALGKSDDVEILSPSTKTRPTPDADAIAQAAKLLATAERPVILAGGGAVMGCAEVELIELAQALGAPVTTSYGGKGAISDRHPLAMGCVRGGRVYGENPIWQVLEASDAVLVVGSRLAHTITSGAGMKLPEKMVHLDIDEAVFDKNFPVSVRLQGDAALGLSALTDALKELGKQPNADAVAIAAEGKAAQRTQLVESGPNQQRAFDVMREAMPDETIVTADAAIAAYWGVRGLEATGPRRFVNVHAWSSIGMAFPAALGAKAGNPDAPVVSIHGDGGFQFNMQELGTAAQYDLGIVQLVFNDDAWGALYDYQDKLQGGRHIGTELTNPDFMALAAAYGLKGVQVDSVDAFGEELRTATRSGEFTLLEVRTPNGFDNFT